MRDKYLYIVIVITGVLLALSSVGAVYFVNAKRDDAIRKAANIESASRYKSSIDSCERGNVLRARINYLLDGGPQDQVPLVDCQKVIPQPIVK